MTHAIDLRLSRASAVIAFCVLAVASAAGAQQRDSSRATSGIHGTVATDSGAPVAGASVMLVEASRIAIADRAGSFTIRDVPAGTYTLTVRRIGFEESRATLELPPGRILDLDVELVRIAQRLTGVSVRADSALTDRRLAAIVARNASSSGSIVRRAQLDSAHGVSVTAFVLRQLHGAHSVAYPARGLTLLASTRGVGSISLPLPRADDNDLSSPRACFFQIIVDGVRLYSPGVGAGSVPDLTDLRVDQVETIEYYPGPAATPAEYGGTGAQCGTIVIWTRAR